MKNLFHEGVKEEIISRVNSLDKNTSPQWGKMNVAQMLAHCIRPLALALGEAEAIPQNFIMRLLGKLIKKSIVSPKRFKPGLPTDATFITTGSEFDFTDSREKLLAIINRFVEKQDTVPDFKHPLFGKLTKDEWGLSQYKHLDHHLTQFGK